MKLRSLELSEFRKFGAPVRLDGLGDGINVLGEPNEFGKSTLLAAIKAVFFERHTARGKVAQAMQHHSNGTSPTIKLEFELGSGLHRIEKRFMHKDPYARLELPDGRRVHGDEAEEGLRALLGFGAPGKQGSTAETIGVWGALWVGQQEAPCQPMLPELGRSTLHACVEAELGSLSGDAGAARIRRSVENQLSSLLDGHGRPRGRYKEISQQLADTTQDLARLQQRRASLEETIQRLARLRRRLAEASTPEAARELEQDLSAARTRREAVLRHSDALRQAVTAHQLAEQQRSALEDETQRRAGRRRELATATQALSEAELTESAARKEVAAAAGTAGARRRELDVAEAGAAAATSTLREANALVAVMSRSEQAARLAKQLEAADAASAGVAKLSGELAAQPADADALQLVRAADADLQRTRVQLDAQATEIELDLLAKAFAGVTLDGAPLTGPRTLVRAVGDAVIDVPGIGRIRIRPAVRDRHRLEEKLGKARAALREALAAVGAADPQAAERRGEERRRLEVLLLAAISTAGTAAPGDAGTGLAPGVEALRECSAKASARVQAELREAGLAQAPTAAEAEAALRGASERERGTAASAVAARAAHAAAQAALGRAEKALAAASAAATETASTLARLRRQDEDARASESDEALTAKLEEAAVGAAAQAALVADEQRRKPSDTLEGANARIRRLEQASAARLEELSTLRQDVAAASTTVASAEGEGLDELVAEAERKEADLSLEQADLEREVAVATLLRDTLAQVEREARERYVAPVAMRLTPHLRELFPGVEVSLDDQLQVTGVARQAGREDVERLSDGTREQVAVLLRLAYADLLLERGRPAMLILDDALAYSDRERLETMFDLLARAAERMQILVLTCRSETFSRLGGNRLRLVQA